MNKNSMDYLQGINFRNELSQERLTLRIWVVQLPIWLIFVIVKQKTDLCQEM